MPKVSQVSKDDCRLAAQLINLVHTSEATLTGKELCAAADAIRWLQSLAVEMAKDFQAQSEPLPPVAPPTGCLPAGIKIKDFKTGKK